MAKVKREPGGQAANCAGEQLAGAYLGSSSRSLPDGEAEQQQQQQVKKKQKTNALKFSIESIMQPTSGSSSAPAPADQSSATDPNGAGAMAQAAAAAVAAAVAANQRNMFNQAFMSQQFQRHHHLAAAAAAHQQQVESPSLSGSRGSSPAHSASSALDEGAGQRAGNELIEPEGLDELDEEEEAEEEQDRRRQALCRSSAKSGSPVASLSGGEADSGSSSDDEDDEAGSSRASTPISPGCSGEPLAGTRPGAGEAVARGVKRKHSENTRDGTAASLNNKPTSGNESAGSAKSSGNSPQVNNSKGGQVNNTKKANNHSGSGSASSWSKERGSTNHLLKQQVCHDPRLAPFECHLDNLDLWHRFHPLDTEMIITKQGRRMFPPVRVTFSLGEGRGAGATVGAQGAQQNAAPLAAGQLQLNPRDKYQVLMDILPYDNKRYRYAYHKSSWQQAGKADPPSPTKLFLHPDGPFTLDQLKRQVISFEKIKLTNNDANKHGYIVLNSMHKYQPRIHLVLWRGRDSQNLANATISQLEQETYKTFIFSETIFTAVTAYQNHSITKLKIDSNPFAKGFRDSSRLTDLELESMQDLMSDGQCPFSPPRAPPHGFPHFLFAAAAAQQQQQQPTSGTQMEDPASTLLRERTLMALDSFLQQQQHQQQHLHQSSGSPQRPPTHLQHGSSPAQQQQQQQQSQVPSLPPHSVHSPFPPGPFGNFMGVAPGQHQQSGPPPPPPPQPPQQQHQQQQQQQQLQQPPLPPVTSCGPTSNLEQLIMQQQHQFAAAAMAAAAAAGAHHPLHSLFGPPPPPHSQAPPSGPPRMAGPQMAPAGPQGLRLPQRSPNACGTPTTPTGKAVSAGETRSPQPVRAFQLSPGELVSSTCKSGLQVSAGCGGGGGSALESMQSFHGGPHGGASAAAAAAAAAAAYSAAFHPQHLQAVMAAHHQHQMAALSMQLGAGDHGGAGRQGAAHDHLQAASQLAKFDKRTL